MKNKVVSMVPEKIVTDLTDYREIKLATREASEYFNSSDQGERSFYRDIDKVKKQVSSLYTRDTQMKALFLRSGVNLDTLMSKLESVHKHSFIEKKGFGQSFYELPNLPTFGKKELYSQKDPGLLIGLLLMMDTVRKDLTELTFSIDDSLDMESVKDHAEVLVAFMKLFLSDIKSEYFKYQIKTSVTPYSLSWLLDGSMSEATQLYNELVDKACINQSRQYDPRKNMSNTKLSDKFEPYKKLIFDALNLYVGEKGKEHDKLDVILTSPYSTEILAGSFSALQEIKEKVEIYGDLGFKERINFVLNNTKSKFISYFKEILPDNEMAKIKW
ncbi:MAG: hypothetical protein DKM50_08255 [Candidatus Margulisiibacteriota bacterium]|nr:MAG: hypothetical protein A2X43_03035 [Candidatus Margulisbacteria bacterium GWD2_39_127]PZM79587.1 MAG: hypothetical protein DKM50_08255 [Candidatus Margulisiibacteriota bacterium]HAR63231.1 hypothetical protein [Candidatus Margulisiibacteriota bacterium]HCY35617.1 hypothetical protein [Candidatus Margulisiibacteriota bacterium]